MDVVQYNIYAHGFGRWQQLGRELVAIGGQASPHTYGGGVSNYVTAHLAGTSDAISYVEWDFAEFAAIDVSAWVIRDGLVNVPSAPGFGLELDTRAFETAVTETGFSIVT